MAKRRLQQIDELLARLRLRTKRLRAERRYAVLREQEREARQRAQGGAA